MAFSPDVNLGNLLTIGGTVGLLLGFLHKYDKKIDLRHQSNVEAAERQAKSLENIEGKLDENTNRTLEVGMQIGKHVAEDEIYHSEFRRGLDQLRADFKDHDQRKH